MTPLSEYIIPFVGLKPGLHSFNYSIKDDFFAQTENALLEQGDVNVALLLNKMENMMILDFSIDGLIKVQCDRCSEDFMLPVKGKNRLIYKITPEPGDETKNDEIIRLAAGEYEINLAPHLYDFINLLVPMRHVHPEKKGKPTCNAEMIKLINEYSRKPEAPVEIDPRWEVLKKLKNSN